MSAWKRMEVFGDATLYLGDALEVMAELPGVDSVVTDPPYGGGTNTNYRRFSGGKKGHARRKDGDGGRYHESVRGDTAPIDVSALMKYREVIVWGLGPITFPSGGALVWVKRKPEAFGTFLSDAELAWVKGSKGVFCFTSFPQAMARTREHPTQKPLDLMLWCVRRIKGEIIADPYMGSGTTGVAALKLGHKFIGVEIEERYYDIACRRIDLAARQERLALGES